MGLEHPYLAIFAIIAFTTAIMGVLYLFIHTYTETLKAPILSSYAQACIMYSGDVVLEVTLRHERGLIVTLQRIDVYSDKGVIVYTPNATLEGVNVTIEGFNGRLGPGQVGRIRFIFPQGYFTENKTYSGLVFFDIGNTVFTFQVVKCPFIVYPYPTTLLDLGLVATAGTIATLGLIKATVELIDIELYSRDNVFYNDTFDTNPFQAGRLIPATCDWGYDSTGGFIYVSTVERPRPRGGECVAYVDMSLPSSGAIYVASTMRIVEGWQYADVVFIEVPPKFYAIGLEYNVTRGYAIRRYLTPAWTVLNRTSDLIDYNVSYGVVAQYVYGANYMALWINTTKRVMVSAIDTAISPRQAGLGVYYIAGARAYTIFDNLLITIDAPPWFVNVTNVPIGWMVVLKDSTGNVVSSGVSIDGNVTLDVWNYFIVSNATLEVYDSYGALVASKRFTYVMGGEVYRVVATITPGLEFVGLAIGVGGSSSILLYNVTDLTNITLVLNISTSTIFNGTSSVAIGRGTLYLLNMTGVYVYDYLLDSWSLVTSSCRSTGLGAGLSVVKDSVVVVPGEGNNTLCIYNMTSRVALLYTILEGNVTPYTCTASYGDTLYVSLLGAEGPLIVAYRVADNTIVKIAQYLIGGYRLFGMTHDGVKHLYYIHEYNELYGAVYRLDTVTGSIEILPILLYPRPRSPGNRLVYYNEHLIYVRGDGTSELYVIPLKYVLS